MRATAHPLPAAALLLAASNACHRPGGDTESGAGSQGDSGCAPVTWFRDADGDGHGDPTATETACEASAGMVEAGDDCDDADPDAWQLSPTTYIDGDGDGFGAGDAAPGCADVAGRAIADGDCDDDDDRINPGAAEVCGDGLDNNCDGDPECHPAKGVVGPQDASAVIVGPAGSGLGTEIARADVTGDGEPDLVLGAGGTSDGDGIEGTYVIAGPVVGDLSVPQDASAWVYSLESIDDGWSLSTTDADGDGYVDLLIGGHVERDSTALYIVEGPVTGSLEFNAEDTPYLNGDDGVFNGNCQIRTGDFWGEDGAPDVVANLYAAHTDANLIYLIEGPMPTSGKLERRAETVISGELDRNEDVDEARALGDMDGDGLGEVGLGSSLSPDDAYRGGTVYLFLNPPQGESVSVDDADRVVYDPDQTLGASLNDAGDVDGDGVADLLASASFHEWAEDEGDTWLLSGAAVKRGFGQMHKVEDLSTAAWRTTEGQYLGAAQAAPGDVSQDGYGEVFLGIPGQGELSRESAGGALLWYGPVEGDYTARDADFRFTNTQWGAFAGYELATGNLEGDPARPVLLVASYFGYGPGTVFQFTPNAF